MKFFIRLDAGSEAVRWHPREGLWKWRCRGKRGKAQAAFPLFPPPLGNLAKGARFPHSHSLASPRMEKWKTKIRFPTFPRRLATTATVCPDLEPKTRKGD